MWASEIEETMRKFPNFIGVFSRDTLPKQVSLPMGLIVNTDAKTEVGTHWVAIFIDKNSFGQYFDSFGLPPFREEFISFLDFNCKKYVFNNITLQCLECITCGHYCCAFLTERFKGSSFKNFISIFSSDTYLNDYIIKYYFKKNLGELN